MATGAGASAIGMASATTAAGTAVKTAGLAALAAKVSVIALGVGALGTAGVVGYRHHATTQAKTSPAQHETVGKPRSRPAPPVLPDSQQPWLLQPVASARPSAAPALQPEVSPPAQSAPDIRPAPALTPRAARPVPTSPRSDRPARALQPRDEALPSGGLAAESLLVETSRAHIGKGNPAAALAQLAEHARRFPHGQLEEEREALRIQALVQWGAASQASVAAAAFERRFPHSIQRDIVRAAVQSIR